MKVIIAACGYGAGNIGDESILAGLKNLITNINPSIIISVMSINPKVTKKMHNLDSFYWMNYKSIKSIFRYINKIKDSDIVLFGGATLGDDTYGIKYPILSTCVMIVCAKLLSKKTGLISIGVNKFDTKMGKLLVKYFYSMTNFITTRDKQSYNILKSMSMKNIYETADAAYALIPEEKSIGQFALKIRGIDHTKKLVAISVLDEVYEGYDYKIKIANICDYLIEKYNYVPVFINHEVRVGMDQEATNDTIKLIRNKDKVKILSTEFYSPELMTSMLQNFQFTIGMRMHILILSTIARIPVIGISRVDKVDNFFSQLDSDLYVKIKDLKLNDLRNYVDKTVLYHDKYENQSNVFSLKKKEDLNKSIEILNKYIKNDL